MKLEWSEEDRELDRCHRWLFALLLASLALLFVFTVVWFHEPKFTCIFRCDYKIDIRPMIDAIEDVTLFGITMCAIAVALVRPFVRRPAERDE